MDEAVPHEKLAAEDEENNDALRIRATADGMRSELCRKVPPWISMENRKDTSTMTGGLSRASQVVMTAVKPRPPESWSDRECSIADDCIIPAMPQRPPESMMVTNMIRVTLMPA